MYLQIYSKLIVPEDDPDSILKSPVTEDRGWAKPKAVNSSMGCHSDFTDVSVNTSNIRWKSEHGVSSSCFLSRDAHAVLNSLIYNSPPVLSPECSTPISWHQHFMTSSDLSKQLWFWYQSEWGYHGYSQIVSRQPWCLSVVMETSLFLLRWGQAMSPSLFSCLSFSPLSPLCSPFLAWCPNAFPLLHFFQPFSINYSSHSSLFFLYSWLSMSFFLALSIFSYLGLSFFTAFPHSSSTSLYFFFL